MRIIFNGLAYVARPVRDLLNRVGFTDTRQLTRIRFGCRVRRVTLPVERTAPHNMKMGVQKGPAECATSLHQNIQNTSTRVDCEE